MRRPLFVVSAAAAALSACGPGGPTVTATNASQSEVEQKVAAAGGVTTPTPGRWEGTVTIHSMEMPGMDAKLAEAMKANITAPQKLVSCLTPEEAKTPHFFSKDDKNCTYDRFTMAGGTIAAVASCKTPTGINTMNLKGTYTGESYHIDTAVSGTGPTAVKMSMTMDAKRVGACKGTESRE